MFSVRRSFDLTRKTKIRFRKSATSGDNASFHSIGTFCFGESIDRNEGSGTRASLGRSRLSYEPNEKGSEKSPEKSHHVILW